MIVLTINSGSTSIKLAAYEADPRARGDAPLRRLAAVHHQATHIDPSLELRDFLDQLPSAPRAVVHRVVHGGTRFTHPVLIDESVRTAIGALAELAPLHNPLAIRWIDAARRLCGPDAAQVATFDTAFFAPLPRVATEYAVSPAIGVDVGVRRYGFHGLAHEAMWRRFCELAPHLPQGGRLITVQLGGGCSITAIDRGRPKDTSMGFSPLEGLVMGTRSGDADPAIVPYLERRLGVSSAHVLEMLNRQAGLLGMTGGESSPEKLIEDRCERAQFALELYCYRARKYLGAYLAVLGGCEGIVFGGGVGEHVPEVRARILRAMQWAGIELDPSANEAARGVEARISASGSPVLVQVIAVQEEPLMVRAALGLLPQTL